MRTFASHKRKQRSSKEAQLFQDHKSLHSCHALNRVDAWTSFLGSDTGQTLHEINGLLLRTTRECSSKFKIPPLSGKGWHLKLHEKTQVPARRIRVSSKTPRHCQSSVRSLLLLLGKI